MTDNKLLLSIIDKNGLKLKFISDKLGITQQALYNKVNGKSEFKVSEMNKLCEVLNLSNKEKKDIFFGN